MRLGRVELKPGFALLLGSVWALAGLEFTAALVLAALLHELGHLVTLAALGAELECMRLDLTGAAIRHRGMSYLGEALCAAMGPLFSIMGAYTAANLGHELFAGVSLVLGLFNLLPLSFLDGGRVIFSLLTDRFGPAAGCVAVRVDNILLVLLALAALVVLLITGGEMTPLVVTLVLILNSNTCKLR